MNSTFLFLGILVHHSCIHQLLNQSIPEKLLKEILLACFRLSQKISSGISSKKPIEVAEKSTILSTLVLPSELMISTFKISLCSSTREAIRLTSLTRRGGALMINGRSMHGCGGVCCGTKLCGDSDATHCIRFGDFGCTLEGL